MYNTFVVTVAITLYNTFFAMHLLYTIYNTLTAIYILLYTTYNTHLLLAIYLIFASHSEYSEHYKPSK